MTSGLPSRKEGLSVPADRTRRCHPIPARREDVIRDGDIRDGDIREDVIRDGDIRDDVVPDEERPGGAAAGG